MKTLMSHFKSSLKSDMMTNSTKERGGKKKVWVQFVSLRTIRGIMTKEGNKKQSKLQILIDRVHLSGLKFTKTLYRLDMKRT